MEAARLRVPKVRDDVPDRSKQRTADRLYPEHPDPRVRRVKLDSLVKRVFPKVHPK